MRKFLVANWKMNTAPSQARILTTRILKSIRKTESVTTVLCPSFSALQLLNDRVRSARRRDVVIGAQDCHWEKNGAYTGEESLAVLASIGCKAVIIGHSERRTYLGESHDMIAKKLAAALSLKSLIPILCVGETHSERRKNLTRTVLKKQITSAFARMSDISGTCLIAYEPVWSISPGRPCKPSDCSEAIEWIRDLISKMFSHKSLSKIGYLYGGSVDAMNAPMLMEEGGVDGFLVGKASLDPKEFTSIHRAVQEGSL